ncbi:MAG: hypothetical protein NC041_10295 [Bacteroides sp.]|nr:hypothetical protein [Prevotella sp.]MCM1408896.1 hypothetical protein [Treponema brennaborense]MCM1470843.1 hypothetical protein [Bacteroides sp.]
MPDKKTVAINAVFIVLVLCALYGIPKKLMESAANAAARRRQAKTAAEETAALSEPQNNADAQNVFDELFAEPLLTESDITEFARNYPQVKKALSAYRLAETKNPSFGDVEQYLTEQNTIDAVREILASAGFGGADPLKQYFVLCNAYGICSYDAMLSENPRRRSSIERMSGDIIAKTRRETSPQDIELVREYFMLLDGAFRAK